MKAESPVFRPCVARGDRVLWIFLMSLVLMVAVLTPVATEAAPARIAPEAISPERAAAAAGERTRIVLAGAVFDPLIEEPDFESLGFARARSGRYGIVQFQPGREAAQQQLEGRGVEFLGYLPNGAFQVRWNAEGRARLAAHPDVRWVGDYAPGYKVSPDLWPDKELPAGADINVIAFRGGDLGSVLKTLEREFPAIRRTAYTPTAPQPRLRYRVPQVEREAFIRRAAELDEVSWIEPWMLPQLHNASSVSPIQNDGTTGTPIWDQDLIGTGQILGISDSGLDRNQCWFTQHNDGSATDTNQTNAQATTPPTPGTTFPTRKIIGYFVQPGASEYDDNATCPGSSSTSFHGTHTSGTMAGDRNNVATPTDPMFLSTDEDGMAPNAQILFQDVGHDTTGCLSGTSGDLGLMFQQAHSVGARIHSNSWGSASGGAYGSSDQEVDEVLWELEDMIIFYSAGNNGPGGNSIGSPGNAKNVVTVGALGSGNSTTTAGFSSRGPTDDGRFKPDIQAPGSSVLSARGDDNDSTPSCPTAASLSGTSMSTPTVAGGTALLRQYFTDGFYPSGARTAANERIPSGALMKAVLLNGTRNLANMPSNADGWGRMFLDNNLFFNTGDRRLRVWSRANDVGLTTSQMHIYTVVVPAGAEFRATLVWFDPTAALGAGIQLVNNLDLEVEGPGPTLWRGNVFSGGVSTTGGSADALNTVEQVRLTAPTAGTYTIRVKGTAVPGNSKTYTNRQGYGLAASYGNCSTAVTNAPMGVSATPTGSGISVGFTPPAGATVHNVYRADGNCSAPAESFDFVGTTASSPFVDNQTQGGFTYAYKVRGADGCSEGPLSSCVTATSTQPCTLFPLFDQNQVTVQTTGTTNCRNVLSWAAGSSSCPLGTGITYNVYRAESPYGPFVLHRDGLTGTTYEDKTAEPLKTYYYIVRAEDSTTVSGGPANGGNESVGSQWVKATPFTTTMTPGTFVDGADSPSFLILETPWTVTNTMATAGTLSYHNAPDGQNYAPDICAALTTKPILLSSSSAVLTYKARYNLESTWDGVVVEISVNSGPWTDLPPTGGYPSSFSSTGSPPVNACGYAASQGAFSGSSGGVFVTRSSNVPATSGSTIQIRWRFSSDPGSEEAGFFLDEVSITGASTCDGCAPIFADGFESGNTAAWSATVP